MADPRFPLAPRSGTGGVPSAPLAGRTGSPDAGGAKARQESESRKVVEESKSGWRLATNPCRTKRLRGQFGLTTSPSRRLFCRMSRTSARTFWYLKHSVSVPPRLTPLVQSGNVPPLVAGPLSKNGMVSPLPPPRQHFLNCRILDYSLSYE